MRTSPASKEETSRQQLLELEPDIRDLFGAVIALTTFAEKTFHDSDAIRDLRGRLEYRLEADEREALFYLIYAINSSARSLHRSFHGEEVQS
jgi:hypothetical protein